MSSAKTRPYFVRAKTLSYSLPISEVATIDARLSTYREFSIAPNFD